MQNTTTYTAYDLHNARMFVLESQNNEAWTATYHRTASQADRMTAADYARRADEFYIRIPYSLARDISGAYLDGWDAAHDLIDKLDADRRN